MKESEYRQSYGCCSNVPEALLHTGDRWDYPKWYIHYIKGEGDRKLPQQVERCLEYLKDGFWKIGVGKSGIGIGSLEASVGLEFIQMSPVTKSFRTFVAKSDGGPIIDISNVHEFQKDFQDSANRNAFIGTYKITERGLNALANKQLP
jgi:hypothetical protein